MLILISPAKKMRMDPDSFPVRELPRFLPMTECLLSRLRALSYEELKALWKCNDSIAKENFARIQNMDLRQNLTCALTSYDGIQYRHLAPDVCSGAELSYLQEHLRILSGFYGVLSPFDGVTPYRLEMQAKLAMGEHGDLYGYWGDRIAKSLEQEGDILINLASKEYAQGVLPHLKSGTRVITCRFAERRGERLVEKGTLCKMARGEMVRHLAETGAKDPAALMDFSRLDFAFSKADSREDLLTFVRDGAASGKKEDPWNLD
ncbi:MAG: peroxide stress protein YaaA [Clostridia bacterium]|nr:peroxide stress protein YaaA [Clostridia bacterium]